MDTSTDFVARVKTLVSQYGEPSFVRDHVVVDALVEEFYTMPGNGSGGLLHIVLDDGNIERDAVEYCCEAAYEAGDEAAMWLAQLLLLFTDDDRAKVLGFLDDPDLDAAEVPR